MDAVEARTLELLGGDGPRQRGDRLRERVRDFLESVSARIAAAGAAPGPGVEGARWAGPPPSPPSRASSAATSAGVSDLPLSSGGASAPASRAASPRAPPPAAPAPAPTPAASAASTGAARTRRPARRRRFSHPHVRNRLERLMGSNVTRLTDRDFMQRLAERIQEEHVAQMQKRIRAREEAEVEREKKLILEGKIPVEQVPRELAEHPVFKISRITSEAIESRRSKGRPLSPDEVERERANLARTSVMTAARNEWQAEVELAEQMARERDKNYLLSEAELRRLRYEAPLIEELRKQETVADLYRLADEIVGGLWIKSKPGK